MHAPGRWRREANDDDVLLKRLIMGTGRTARSGICRAVKLRRTRNPNGTIERQSTLQEGSERTTFHCLFHEGGGWRDHREGRRYNPGVMNLSCSRLRN